jgi:ribosomal protein S18 acetylase RimI-like enzyme
MLAPGASDGASGRCAPSGAGLTERERILGFLSATDRSVAGSILPLETASDGERSAQAWAIIDRRRPLVWDANYVWVAHARSADAHTLALTAERAQGAMVLEHRLVVVADQQEGQELCAGFAELGWQSAPYVLMVHRHVDLLVAAGQAGGAGEQPGGANDAFLAARRVMIMEEPWGSAEAAEQILSRDLELERATGGRRFAVAQDGVVASTCELFGAGAVAQVESVGTRRAFRNRGHGRAVVSVATRAARAHAQLVFLCADASDWPQYLYQRLGFEPIGLLHRFCPVLPGLVAG